MKFDNLVGNSKIKELLNNIVEGGNISHSYMFIGESGIGKLLFAKEFAKAILCEDDINKPCNKCKSCIEFESLNNPDFEVINPEESSIKIEQIRMMNKKVLEKPIVSQKKVYIINDSDKMTKEAQNSLLKTLEEPPKYVIIILITANENVFLNTIRSRCIKINFDKLENEDIKMVLLDKYNYNADNNIIDMLDGSLEKVVKIKNSENIYLEIEKIFLDLKNINIIDFLNMKSNIFSSKEDTVEILDYINRIFFKLVNRDVNNSITYINCMNIIQNIKNRLKNNSNFDMTIDNFLITVWEEVNGKYNRS